MSSSAASTEYPYLTIVCLIQSHTLKHTLQWLVVVLVERRLNVLDPPLLSQAAGATPPPSAVCTPKQSFHGHPEKTIGTLTPKHVHSRLCVTTLKSRHRPKTHC